MKLVLSVVLQTVLLLIVSFLGFLLGATVPSLRVSHVVSHTAVSVRTYDFNWLIAVALVYLVLLLIGALRGRMLDALITATVSLVLTVAIVVLFTQLGVKDTPLADRAEREHLSAAATPAVS